MTAATFDWVTFYAALDARRRDQTWRDVAREAGVSASTITRLKQGHALDVRTTVALADWARTSLDLYVVGGFRDTVCRDADRLLTVATDYLDVVLPPWRAEFLSQVLHAADGALGDIDVEVWRKHHPWRTAGERE